MTCARYFDHKFNEFWKIAKSKNGFYRNHNLKHWFWKYEIQQRGKYMFQASPIQRTFSPTAPHTSRLTSYFYNFLSGSIHVHCMVWLENAPEFNPDGPSSFEACEKFIDQYITCKRDDTLGEIMNKQYHKHTRTCVIIFIISLFLYSFDFYPF